MTASIHEREAFLAAEYALFEEARRRGDRLAAWHHLERAHIVAQPLLGAHLLSHGYMLRYAIEVRDAREVAGQIMRVGLALIGSLAGKLPVGNTGRSRISAFAPMPVTPDLAKFV